MRQGAAGAGIVAVALMLSAGARAQSGPDRMAALAADPAAAGLSVPGVRPSVAAAPNVPAPPVPQRLRAARAAESLRAAEYGMLAAPLHFAGALEGGDVVVPGLFGGVPPVPGGPAPTRRLRLALFPPDAGGQFAGSALLVEDGGRVLAGGPVRGEQRGDACHLQMELAGQVSTMDGACTVAQLSGTLRREGAPDGFHLGRFVLAKGGAGSDGEAWLAAE